MSVANWRDDYSVKVTEFDNQHKVLFGHINDIHNAIVEKKDKEELGLIINKLIKYTKDHFGIEEQYFAKFGYPDAESHKAQHKIFVDKMIEFQEDFKSGKMLLSLKIINFLKDWLVKHIKGVDQKYSNFFNDRGLC